MFHDVWLDGRAQPLSCGGVGPKSSSSILWRDGFEGPLSVLYRGIKGSIQCFGRGVGQRVHPVFIRGVSQRVYPLSYGGVYCRAYLWGLKGSIQSFVEG